MQIEIDDAECLWFPTKRNVQPLRLLIRNRAVIMQGVMEPGEIAVIVSHVEGKPPGFLMQMTIQRYGRWVLTHWSLDQLPSSEHWLK